MARYVLKFGGSSMADVDCMRRAASIIQQTLAEDDQHQCVVVVSAMAGETDRLVQLMQSITPHPSNREYAACVSSGEQASSALLAMMLQSYGLSAQSVSGWQMALETDGVHHKSHIKSVNKTYFEGLLSRGIVPVVTGFQGVNSDRDITTLGRGGSDTTAVALTAFLNADECIIYTDVQGVFSADPRIVPQARCLDTVSYDEMLTYATLGAKVLQTRSVELARKFMVPVRVKSTFDLEAAGTLLVSADHAHHAPLVSGVASVVNQIKVMLTGLDFTYLSALRQYIKEHSIDVDMLTEDPHDQLLDVSFVLHADELPVLCQFSEDFHVQAHLAKVSLVGQHMQSHAGFAAEIIQQVTQAGVVIHSIASSATKVSILIELGCLKSVVSLLHAAFIEKQVTAS